MAQTMAKIYGTDYGKDLWQNRATYGDMRGRSFTVEDCVGPGSSHEVDRRSQVGEWQAVAHPAQGSLSCKQIWVFVVLHYCCLGGGREGGSGCACDRVCKSSTVTVCRMGPSACTCMFVCALLVSQLIAEVHPRKRAVRNPRLQGSVHQPPALFPVGAQSVAGAPRAKAAEEEDDVAAQ